MTEETREEYMACLRVELAMSPEEQREHTARREAAEAAALAEYGPIEDRDISRTKWADPMDFRLVRPAPESPPRRDEDVER